MRKTYKVHLKNGSVIKVRADDVSVKYDNNGFTEWSFVNIDRWLVFLPPDLVAIERVG